jgi:hypothetical protein
MTHYLSCFSSADADDVGIDNTGLLDIPNSLDKFDMDPS